LRCSRRSRPSNRGKRIFSESPGVRQSELHNIPEEKKVLAELEREKESYAEVYNQLLSQSSRTEVSKQMEISDKATTFRIVDPPSCQLSQSISTGSS